MEEKKIIDDSELESVSGGYTTEKTEEYKKVPCPLCGYQRVSRPVTWHIETGGNWAVYGSYKCGYCQREWDGTRVGTGEKTTWKNVVVKNQ